LLDGFSPEDAYLSECHLCFAVRKFLVAEKGVVSWELQPEEFYSRV
jgi:hypothetical protein